MPELNIQDKDFSFEPNLSVSGIILKRLKVFLSWLFIIFLALFGLYGILILMSAGALNIFYFSLITDMFLFYLWRCEKTGAKIKRFKLLESNDKIEISSFLDKSAQKSLERAWLFCYRKGGHSLRPIHLFFIFLKDKKFKIILRRLNCYPADIIKKTKSVLDNASFFSKSAKRRNILGPKISSDFKKIFFDAYLPYLIKERKKIDYLDILRAISRQKNLVGMIFDEFGVSPEEIEKTIEWAQIEEQIKKREKVFFWRRIFKPKGKLNRAMTAAATPLLDSVSHDLTFLARQGSFEMVLGRDKEIEEIFNLFSLERAGIVLTGQSEVGKKAVLKKLAQMMVMENVPNFLKDKRLVKLELGNLVGLSEASQKGEEYLKQILFEVNRAGNVVLVIDGVDRLVGLKSREGGLDFADILASALDNYAFLFIGTTTLDGFASKIEGKILGRVLAKIEMALPFKELLWQILITKIFIIEKELKVFFSVDALDRAIELADRYIYGKALLGKVIDLLTESAYIVRQGRGAGSGIGEKDVIELVAQKTKIPLGQVRETEKEKLLQLEELIHQSVINQEEAVKAVGNALRRSRLQLYKDKKTICNFLFVGPTGVGKTELAKTLARVYFGDEKRMVRLDMSEYQEKRSIRRLIGLRTEEGVNKGYLTEVIKRQPYSLLLLDEIEKAHPDILNLFLQVMDDGRLTDASGETINFTNVILIATSNAGTQFIQQKIKQSVDYDEIYRELKEKVLLEDFKPEFLNRFDKITLFKALTVENMVAITDLFLNTVKEKLEEKGAQFEVEDVALKELAMMGFDPLYGARSLKRVIQDKVESVLARLFLEDKIKRRDKILLKEGLVFKIEKAPEI